MDPANSLSKRIKRHVTGRIRDYFIVTHPGFERLCLKELTSLPITAEQASAVPGGVEFKARLEDCYLANLNLRTAGRILLRIQSFKASNFKQLEKRFVEIPWEIYLARHSLFEIHVTVRHCRLYHSEAVGARLSETITGILGRPAVEDENSRIRVTPQRIFVRGVDDRFTVSIDSSGDHLYKRGVKKHTGRAPLRETLAAASLLLAGYTGVEPVIDPMCGAGTYSLEALLIAKKIPPGWFREFAFMQWPSFRPERFEYLKRQYRNRFESFEKPVILASDKDPEACGRLEQCVRHFGLSDGVHIVNKDFFDVAPSDFADQAGVVAINPPYGRRLENRATSEQLFTRICARLNQEYKGWKVILISPTQNLANKVTISLESYPLFHGGLKPVLLIGKIR